MSVTMSALLIGAGACGDQRSDSSERAVEEAPTGVEPEGKPSAPPTPTPKSSSDAAAVDPAGRQVAEGTVSAAAEGEESESNSDESKATAPPSKHAGLNRSRSKRKRTAKHAPRGSKRGQDPQGGVGNETSTANESEIEVPTAAEESPQGPSEEPEEPQFDKIHKKGLKAFGG